MAALSGWPVRKTLLKFLLPEPTKSAYMPKKQADSQTVRVTAL